MLPSFGKETARQAYKRGPPSLVYMLQHSLQRVSYNDIVVVHSKSRSVNINGISNGAVRSYLSK